MALESWLPVGYSLPDGASCRKPLQGDKNWQLMETDGNGAALIVNRKLHERWLQSGLVDLTSFVSFAYGPDELFEISCGPSQLIVLASQSRSPNTKNEALAFAMALKATRTIDPATSLHDAIYVECLGVLLPTFSLSPHVSDDIILGFWLTGGVKVSTKSFRRLNQIMNWMGPSGLKDVVSAAGMIQITKDAPKTDTTTSPNVDNIDKSVGSVQEDEDIFGIDNGRPFILAGRPQLEVFFNEHIVDIIRNKERYAALGIGFPSAIILHGPPGCGKTFAVEQLIEYLGWPSFEIDASSVASPYIHDTSKKIAEIFDKAMKYAPSVLVIDEMEAFLADRESGSGSSHHRVEEVAEFLRRIPEATKSEVLVVAMTNRVEMIDSAIMRRGRFDHVIGVGPATKEEVKALLDKLLSTLPKDDGVDSDPLAERLSGRPLSDVAFVIREGARLCAKAGQPRIEQRFLIEALNSTPSRVNHGTERSIGFL